MKKEDKNFFSNMKEKALKEGYVSYDSKIYTHEFVMAYAAAEINKDGEFVMPTKSDSVKELSKAFTESMQRKLNSRSLAVEFSKLIAA
jgi:hypothetical protein